MDRTIILIAEVFIRFSASAQKQAAESGRVTDCFPCFVSHWRRQLWHQRPLFELVLSCLVLGGAEHLPAADYPSDPCFSGTRTPSPCLNVTLVMPGRIITRSLRKASVFDLGLRRGHSQVAFIVINEFFFFFFFSPTLSSLQRKDARTHTVNKQEKVSHCWVIADVSNPHWETFNFQLCLAFLLSNHFCDKWSFHSWEAVERFCARLLPQ